MSDGPAYSLDSIGTFSESLAIAGILASAYADSAFLAVEVGATSEIHILRGARRETTLDVRKKPIETQPVEMLAPTGFARYVNSSSERQVFLADLGDAALNRTDADSLPSLYRFTEPDPDSPPDYIATHRIKISYPDAPHDVEAFFVDPLTGDGYLFAKESTGDVQVFKVPAEVLQADTTGSPATANVILVAVATAWAVNGGGPSGASISSDGLRILIRDSRRGEDGITNIPHAAMWPRTAEQTVEDALSDPPWMVPLPPMSPDGTAITFKFADTGYSYYVIEDSASFADTLYWARQLPGDPSQSTVPTLSSLCVSLGRPFVMTGLLRDILTRKFSNADNIEDPDLKGLLWKSGTATNILIESAHRWVPAFAERRPAVILKRNTCQNLRRGVGDQRLGPHVDSEGHEHYVTYWVGSHTLFCIGGTGAQAEILGSEVQRELTEFGPVIRRKMGLLQFQVLQIGAVAKLEEAQENFVVPITVGWAFEERWVLRYEAPLLRHISLSMLLEG